MMTVNGTEIGLCIYPLDKDLVDYSRFERDEFGDITVIDRGFSSTITYQVEVDKDEVTNVRQLLAGLTATVANYKGHPDIPFTHSNGYLRGLKFEYKDWGHIVATLTVETETKDG